MHKFLQSYSYLHPLQYSFIHSNNDNGNNYFILFYFILFYFILFYLAVACFFLLLRMCYAQYIIQLLFVIGCIKILIDMYGVYVCPHCMCLCVVFVYRCVCLCLSVCVHVCVCVLLCCVSVWYLYLFDKIKLLLLKKKKKRIFYYLNKNKM